MRVDTASTQNGTPVRRSIRFATSLGLAALALCACAPVPHERITLGRAPVRAYMADTDEERARGLQGYEPLAAGEGMLFVFGDPAVRTFAMKDVSFPIDIVFIDTAMCVSAIEPLDPGDTRLVTSPGPSRYVVELPQGWAAEHGVVVGVKLTLEE